MHGIVTINTDLISSIISEVESDGGMREGGSDVDKDLSNDLIGIDADRVWPEGAWLLPRSLWRSNGGGASARTAGAGR